MTAAPASVIIVSRNRPDALARCLTGVGQLYHPRFEIVVVADSATIAGLDPRWPGRIKVAVCDTPNISVARNIGIALATGEVLAFVDDDAVPEPTWLCRLTAPFADPAVMATGGYVRGRNGLSFQWRGRMVDARAQTQDLPDATAPLRVDQHPGRALKTEGTNMALRQTVLQRIGGFDPALRFYLDETDINLRLAATGAVAVLVPDAQVHHGFAASDRRRDDRVPVTLHDVGASLAVFLRKHDGQADPRRLADETAGRRRALIAHMVAGRIEPRDVARILDTLAQGWRDGCTRPLPPEPPVPTPQQPFLPFRADPLIAGHRTIAGWRRDATRLRDEARIAARAGWVVSLYLFSITARYHRIEFDRDGYWVQRGGLFGRSRRDDPPFRPWRRDPRLARESRSVAQLRQLGRDSGDLPDEKTL